MNWTSFLFTLALVYLAYYGLNLLYDMLRTRRPPKTDSTGDVLFFDEDVRPEIIVPPEEPAPQADADPETPHIPQATDMPDEPRGLSGTIRSTGAVGLRELFHLAKDNLIEYTGDISYA